MGTWRPCTSACSKWHKVAYILFACMFVFCLHFVCILFACKKVYKAWMRVWFCVYPQCQCPYTAVNVRMCERCSCLHKVTYMCHSVLVYLILWMHIREKYIQTHAHTYARKCTFILSWRKERINIYIYIYTYIHIHTYMYIYIYIYIYIYWLT